MKTSQPALIASKSSKLFRASLGTNVCTDVIKKIDNIITIFVVHEPCLYKSNMDKNIKFSADYASIYFFKVAPFYYLDV